MSPFGLDIFKSLFIRGEDFEGSTTRGIATDPTFLFEGFELVFHT